MVAIACCPVLGHTQLYFPSLRSSFLSVNGTAMRLEDVKRYLPFQSSRSPSQETIYEPLRGEAGTDGEKSSVLHDYRAPKHGRTKWIAGFVIGVSCGAACTWLLFVSSIVIVHEAGLASDAYFGHSKSHPP
jgi:hypothetical protein